MSALIVLIIRHGEKPGETWPGEGRTGDGSADPESLVIRGWQRAGAWAALFGTDLGWSDYPKPSITYAANPDMSEMSEHPSKCRYETIIPLADKLQVEVVTRNAKGAEPALAVET